MEHLAVEGAVAGGDAELDGVFSFITSLVAAVACGYEIYKLIVSTKWTS